MMVDIKGEKFGKWTVIQENGKNRHGQLMWLCVCECGKESVVMGGDLRTGRSKSCGCWHKENLKELKTTHGMSNSSEFRAWADMLNRCNKKNIKSYKNYGGRGIKVCDRWLDSFENFYADMGPKPTSKHSLDRIDNDGDYTPKNCRWTTMKEQINNRRNSVKYKGETASDASIRLGGNRNLITSRIRLGWSLEKAFTTAVGQNSRI